MPARIIINQAATHRTLRRAAVSCNLLRLHVSEPLGGKQRVQMTTTEKCFYTVSAVTFLVAWIPAVLAQRRGQSRRLSYLAPIILYLFMKSLYGWASSLDTGGHSLGIWAFGHGRGALPPIGYGLPLCLVVLAWDTIANLRLRPSSQSQLEARIAQELSEQAQERKRKDYW